MFSLYVALVYDVSDIGYKSRLFFKDHSSALETDMYELCCDARIACADIMYVNTFFSDRITGIGELA